MCVHDWSYKNAVIKRDAATKEKERCAEAINYYDGWKPQIQSCMEYLDGMISQTNAIANSCAEIILNGKPIDQGTRHYPNGGAANYASSLKGIKDNLQQLIAAIDEQLTVLIAAEEAATKDEEYWKGIVEANAKPRADCIKCFPNSSTSANPNTYSRTTSSRTTSTGCGSRTTSSSTRTTTRRTNNRAVAVPL